ncbi:MAG: heavy metal-binding domain-containing protein [Acidobacteriota bacterium]
MKQRLACLVLLSGLAGTAAPTQAIGPQRGARPAPEVPPVSMTCPMHPDVVDSTPGSCPICKMSLVPVRLESVWTCPVHAVVAQEHAGVCPIDRRDLIQVTMAVTFTCAGHPEINQIQPGTCPDGKATIKTRTLRPHGNHNPQYGGQFFMAPDNTHHLEGALPRARLFRLYLYDDYARPLPADRMNAVQARVVTRETFDPATRATTEIAAFRLRRAGRGYLEARIDTAALPAQVTAKVRFKSDAPEYRFDFTFTELSRRPAPASMSSAAPGRAPAAASASVPGGTPRPPAAATSAAAVPAPAPTAGPTSSPTAPPPAADPGLAPAAIPDSVPEILVQLQRRHQEIGDLVERGIFSAVWVPAFQARDLAIALEARLGELPAAAREAGEPAIKRLVRTAWLLDAFGDIGNRQQIVDAYAIFGAAVDEVVSAFQ